MLTEIQINSLKSLIEPMTLEELEETLDLVLDELFKRDLVEIEKED